MEQITLETIHRDLAKLKRDMIEIKIIIEEDLPLSKEVIEEIEESRKRTTEEFVSHEEMKKEFS